MTTERAHPLDSVVEAIAGLIARFTTCASLSGSDPEYVAEATAAARAALQVARQMREGAVVGWARPVGDGEPWRWTFQRADLPYDWCGDEPPRALLVPVPDAEPTTEGETSDGA